MGKGKDNGNYKHGLRHTTEYNSYANARQRCNNPKNPDFKYYGGRGIQFLFDSFQGFLDEVGMKPSPAHSIDRINVNGHYETGNVKWSLMPEQCRNRRRTKLDKDKVADIRSAYATGNTTQKDLATKYKVVQTGICKIVRNETWKLEEAA